MDVKRYRFEVTLPDTGKRIEVVARIEAMRLATVRALQLDLLAPMQVLAASTGCGAQATEAPFTHDGRRVAITLPGEGGAAAMEGMPPSSDSVCVTLRYAGAPADGLVIGVDSARRWRAFGDNWPDRARHWLATIDHPSDKALVEFEVHAPAGRRVVAVSSKSPIPTYLMVIAAAPLVETKLATTSVPQSVFTAPEQARAMPGNFARADDIVRFFERIVAPFPYERLAHLQSSTRFGGMENAGAIFYADALFRSPEGVGVGLIAHETAHQWFGDAVTEREWGHLWLSEGFATYFAALYTEYAFGDSAFRAEREELRRTVTSAAVVSARPVLDTAQAELMQLLNANSYQKGGFILHMLRREVGDSAFFAGVRGYYAAGAHRNALTSDLRIAMERAAKRDLGWFFDQWLRRPGFPKLEVSWRHDPATETLTFLVLQGTTSRGYRFTLGVELEDPDGVKRLVQVEVPAQQRVEVRLREKIARAPRAVRYDPLVELLATIRTP